MGRRARLALPTAMLCLSAGVAAGPQVLVLNETNAPPYSNAERTGYYDVIVSEAFRRAGLALQIVAVPAERALLLSNSGAADGELNRNPAIEKAYPNLIRVPEKLGDMQFVAFGKDGSTPGSLDAFRGRSVGFIRGWVIYERAMAGNPDRVAVGSAGQMFDMLQLGRLEVALYERRMGMALLAKKGISDVRILEPPLFAREQFIYLHKSHAAHAPALAAALREMKRDGAYQRAFREKLEPWLQESPR